jgi:hypothetical protein
MCDSARQRSEPLPGDDHSKSVPGGLFRNLCVVVSASLDDVGLVIGHDPFDDVLGQVAMEASLTSVNHSSVKWRGPNTHIRFDTAKT